MTNARAPAAASKRREREGQVRISGSARARPFADPTRIRGGYYGMGRSTKAAKKSGTATARRSHFLHVDVLYYVREGEAEGGTVHSLKSDSAVNIALQFVRQSRGHAVDITCRIFG